MRSFAIALLVSTPLWAQTHPNGESSKTVQQQQKQADYAKKGHPKAGAPHEEKASLRTKESPAKTPRPKKGQAGIRVQK